MKRRPLTYGLFAVAGALCAAALAMPRHDRNVTPPEPPPSPPPLVQKDPPPPPQVLSVVEAKPAPRPRIEVVFALDTTGSMSGLIDGAKRKIWSIADYIASGQPKPDLRIGLVAYRDKGDDYVTRFYDLSDDLDTVFEHLSSFEAAGGGDTPEHVAKALHDAVDRTSWSQGGNVLRIVYLVGDAPPHVDYHDGYDYQRIAREAGAKGIRVNTIRCGSDEETAMYWKEIAQLGHGNFMSIEQDGGVATVATPYDTRLAELDRKLAGTAIGYGEHRAVVAHKVAMAAAAPAAVAADRAGFAAKGGMGAMGAVSGGGDLIEDVLDGKADLAKLKAADLPAEIAGKSVAEQRAYVESKKVQRQAILDEIRKESAARETFLRHAEAKAPSKSAFDGKVRSSLKAEASSIGVMY